MKAKRQRSAEEFAVEPVASFTECTGLMPALPEDEAEEEARAALYSIHSAKDSRQE